MILKVYLGVILKLPKLFSHVIFIKHTLSVFDKNLEELGHLIKKKIVEHEIT